MDFFDRLLPKPIRNEEFVFTSGLTPDQLAKEIRETFKGTRYLNFSPNLTGHFISAYEFNAQPKWSLLVVSAGSMIFPAVRMNGIIGGLGSGSSVHITLIPSWILGFFSMAPVALAMVLLITVPNENLARWSTEGVTKMAMFLVSLMSFTLLVTWIAKHRFKRNFVKQFKLLPHRDGDFRE